MHKVYLGLMDKKLEIPILSRECRVQVLGALG